jgi:class 3 adenylate cyclase
MAHGLGRIRADQLDTELRGLAVWDGAVGDGPGGTGDQVLAWQASGVATEIIDLSRLLAQRGAQPALKAVGPSAASATSGQGFTGVKAMLFADAAGFSKLSDEQVPSFVNRFLGAVGELCRGAKTPPVMGNTWGDGLFFVFDTPAAAGHFALDMCETISSTSWAAFGLPAELNLRIGLHAGPVYEHVDPITGRPNFSGAHVSRAARIEPITPTGQVYASEPFAALCAADGNSDLVCDYVGQTPLAKGYGTFRTYHVRRRPC